MTLFKAFIYFYKDNLSYILKQETIAMNDQKYMELALKLAKKGQGFVSPNPLVGAVIVKEDRKSVV